MLEERKSALRKALNDPEPTVRSAASDSLEKIESLGELSRTLEHLKTGDRGQKIQAIFTLGRINDPRTIPPLLAMLKSSDPDIRSTAVQVLGQKHDPKTIGPVVKHLGDPDSAVRVHAARALGFFSDRRLVPYLAKVLGDRDEQLVLEAVKSLRSMGFAEAEKPLISLLDHDHPTIRTEAAAALGDLDITAGSTSKT